MRIIFLSSLFLSFVLIGCDKGSEVEQPKTETSSVEEQALFTEADKVLVQKMGIELLVIAENYNPENFEERQRTIFESASKKNKETFFKHLPRRVAEVREYESHYAFEPDLSTVQLKQTQYGRVFYVDVMVEGIRKWSTNTSPQKEDRVEMVAKMILDKTNNDNTVEHRGWTSRIIQ